MTELNTISYQYQIKDVQLVRRAEVTVEEIQ